MAMMDFGSLRRQASERSKENRKKTFSISNISFTSGNSSTTAVIRKSLNISLPRDLGIQQDVDSKVVKVSKGGSAHLSGVIQVGDLVNVFPNELDLRHSPMNEECPLTSTMQSHVIDDEFVNVNILYGVLQVESRPLCPLIVEIGNRNNTSLGLALADAPGEKIRVSSIQPGSLAERCGYLKPGDILISLQVRENEKIACSPYYTSLDTAQIIRRITSSMPSVIFTILPYEAEQLQLQQQHRSLFNMLSSTGGGGGGNNVQYSCSEGGSSSGGGGGCNSNPNNKNFGSASTLIPDCGQQNEEEADENNGVDDSSFLVEDESNGRRNRENIMEAENGSGGRNKYRNMTKVLSFSLWKDRLYEDWGFSLTDSNEEEMNENCSAGSDPASNKCNDRTPDSPSSSSGRINSSHGQCPKHSPCSGSRGSGGASAGSQGTGSEILQIRPGGPAFAAGLLPGDRIMEINHQDVSHLESTMLVPILASLEDSLNLTVIRISDQMQS